MSADEFAENRNFLKPSQQQGIDEEAFREFSQQHGSDVVKGYKMAIADMLDKIEKVWRSPGDAGKRKSALALYKYLESILHLDPELNESNFNSNNPPKSSP